ncbi:aspartate/tyrosine/aromatic aminotransferase [Shewanella sp. JNE10-2]|uniref:amino acid aminotransferase n=1 Tax=unclassified Shewanella TaxID=196818 RepID=UPI002006C54A|nr:MULTISPECIES: amino acid aminotransferase [unclassified Shewanella]MCK7629307.1 aspartate/tyrosine/aromatic aminotransferase [Shewanella sp. JNE9-1]MCK7634204.1 aspartate/tyrosine/aromatic aminotransferase [Shewanella sp. JNE17]MCK7644377.1 aspartate/tyrosine/aromatic aminotransferase [Shewanella sp. JNE3-1]MCK7649429.1 aspartate/tyrosine/aromatic aminotransferase [Shewanella sp. JNE8]MCK7652547.1 aspartate/tyrosine/aromatic aminotransferase [Shewanella sp. JNE4-1]
MFNSLIAMPADPILGLLTQYREDSHPQKVDLGVGVYKDPTGVTPILSCVKKAEKFRLDTETTKVYIGPTGSPQFNTLMTELAFGAGHSAIIANRIRTVSTPGGTGALRVAGDFIKRCNPNAVLWVSDPTWANHIGLFEAAGITVKTYPYYDYDSKSLKFDEMLAALSQVSPDDVVLFHACCHNPSGMDFTTEQWDKVVALTKVQGFTPLIDMAYQGFGDGVDIDAYGVRHMAAAVDNMILCSSCSKNFGLYRERIGSCSVIAKDANTANVAQSVLLYVVRCLYSMPPAHGAAIVETILGSKELTQEWLDELKVMRDRINGNRAILVDKLKANGVNRDFSFIARQKGMFSFLGVAPEQVARLQKEFSIYMVGSSRISIAGISEDNVDYLAQSIAKVI